MARSKSYQKRRKAKNKKFFLFIFLILLASGSYHYYSSKQMDAEINRLDKEIISNEKKIEHINNEIVEIEEDFKIRNTDDFKEKIAEERLGMVRENKDEDEQKDKAND